MKLLALALAAALTFPSLPALAEDAECPSLRKRLANIDAQARQRSTEALTAARKKIKDRMYELGCSEIG